MALFDREQQKIVLRVVYDGAERAGKTTNVAQLYTFFTSRRRSEIFTPETSEGRTLFFDWMQLEGGLVGGYSIRCQIITVPGQSSLSRRRWQLLKTADVVVFVCDSTPQGIEQARPMFQLVRDYLGSLKHSVVPLILQANKQDMEGALPPADVAAAFDFNDPKMLAGARATEGAGVRETAVIAIRAAANMVERLVIERGVESLAGVEETGEALYRSMLESEAHGLDDARGDAAWRPEAAEVDLAARRGAAARAARPAPDRAETEASATAAREAARLAEAETAAREALRKAQAELAAIEAARRGEVDTAARDAARRAEI